MLQTFFLRHPADAHPADLFSNTMQTYTLQTFFLKHPADAHPADLFSNTMQTYTLQTLFFNTLQTNNLQTLFYNTLQALHAADLIFQHPADLTSCRHYWPKTCCRQSCCRQTPCRQSSCRQKHPADKTCCRRKIMSARILHIVCRKIMSAGCFGSCDATSIRPACSQLTDSISCHQNDNF